MSAVAETLGVARSNLAARKKGMTKPRGRYHKAGDVEIAPLIRAIVDERPTYGYRRICALANRKLRAEGKPPVTMAAPTSPPTPRIRPVRLA
jgi:putative transposase